MPSRALRIVRLLTHLSCAAVGGTLIVLAALYLHLSPKLPSVEVLRTAKFQTPMRLYSQDLKLIGEYGEQRRQPIGFEAIPPLFIKALLAAEDDNFYSHIGVNPNGLARAAFELLRTGSIQSGGSTITMQVARNFFLSKEQTFVRKFNEILLALRIERHLDKNAILTLYCNKIFLGNRAYGIAAAAEVYFGKPLSELALPDLAMIAGLPKAPSAYNPASNPERARERRDWILGRMLHLGHIDLNTYHTAVATPVSARIYQTQLDIPAPYVAEMARREVFTRYGESAYADGLRVITTIRSDWQLTADKAVADGLTEYDQRHGYRGAEAHIADTGQWRNRLAAVPVIQGLVPAVVTHVGRSGIRVVQGDGTELELSGKNGLTRRITDFTGAFRSGDLIRLRSVGKRWELAQLPQAQATLVALDPLDGAIRALVGGFDFGASHFNRATQARRQPGSSFKPFIYASALERGFTAASIFHDAPIVFDDPSREEPWRPENDNGEFYGPIRLREALYLSRNLVSIRVLQAVGIHNAIDSLTRFGFDPSELSPNLSLALGTSTFTPLQMATGYAIFANGGYRVTPYLIERIEDAQGNPLFTANPERVCPACGAPGAQNTAAAPAAPQVMDPRIAYIMDSMLRDVIRRGTATRALQLKRGDLAGKTGTTNGPRDAWFSGYNPTLVTSVWFGFDDNRVLGANEYGSTAALPIWMNFMGATLAGTAEAYRPRPPGMLTVRIDPVTGLRAHPGRNAFEEELFLEESAPGAFAPAPESPGSETGQLPDDLL
jgi:penicillin-binding protein 1A